MLQRVNAWERGASTVALSTYPRMHMQKTVYLSSKDGSSQTSSVAACLYVPYFTFARKAVLALVKISAYCTARFEMKELWILRNCIVLHHAHGFWLVATIEHS